MDLVIVESPNKCHTISSILGSSYTVLATAGHITLIKPEYAYHTGIDVKNDFKISYEFDPDKKDMLKKIKDAAKKAKKIFVCSDPDREGESIANEVRNLLHDQKDKLHRAIFNEITPKAVKAAIANPIPFDEDMIQAAETRQVLDRLIGYRISPISRQIGCESAGRVQSALLQLICKKEYEIQKFVPMKYYDIFIDFSKNGKKYSAKLKIISKKKVDRITDGALVNTIIGDCDRGEYIVSSVSSKEKKIQPKLPLTSATLQQIASNVLGFSPSKTMSCAQHLFEKALITYHRTDAVRFSDDFIASAERKISDSYGQQYYRGLVIPKDANKDAQNGHESVRPTDLDNDPDKVSQLVDGPESKLYRLIYLHTLAAFFIPATVRDTEILIENGKYEFSINGRAIVDPSFLAFYNNDTDEEELPIFRVREQLRNVIIRSENKETQPPARYSEAGLVKLMKETGIGRPSTYASAIETLKKREYIDIEKKAVHATDKGIKLDRMLAQYFPTIINTEYTANMETDLDTIAAGKTTRSSKLTAFWSDFEPVVLSAAKSIKAAKPAPTVYPESVCPACGSPLYIKESKYGKFVCCSKYPKCKFTASLDENGKIKEKTKKVIVDTGIICPKCKKGHLVERTAKSTGEVFYGCNHFPKCKFTMKKDEFTQKYKKKK